MDFYFHFLLSGNAGRLSYGRLVELLGNAFLSLPIRRTSNFIPYCLPIGNRLPLRSWKPVCWLSADIHAGIIDSTCWFVREISMRYYLYLSLTTRCNTTSSTSLQFLTQKTILNPNKIKPVKLRILKITLTNLKFFRRKRRFFRKNGNKTIFQNQWEKPNFREILLKLNNKRKKCHLLKKKSIKLI